MASEDPPGGEEAAFSFMDKVRFMMYGEQEREAFLIEKKEKEEKKKGMRTRALSLHQQGWSWTKIATELGCHRTTVMRLVHKWQQTGCIGDLPHRRKPRADQQQQPLPAHNRLPSPPTHPLKARWQEENRRLPPQQHHHHHSNNNQNHHHNNHNSSNRSTTVTVRRRLKELRSQLGIQSPPSPEMPVKPLRNGNVHCEQQEQKLDQKPPQHRLPSKPARSLVDVSHFTDEELGRLVFSDMKIFLADRDGGIRVWRLGQPPLDSYSGLQDFFQKGGLSATFWLCLSGSGKRGHILHIPNELTEERYVQILHNGLLPSAAAIYGLNAHRFLFAQDKASIQASPVVEDFLRQQQVQCVEWPARSADLNPCDLLWPEVEASLNPSTPPKSVTELVQMVRSAYETVDSSYIEWLVAPVRIRSLCKRMMARMVNDDSGDDDDKE